MCMRVWIPCVHLGVTACLYPPLYVSVCMHLCGVPTVRGRTVYAPVCVYRHLCVYACPPCVPVREHLCALCVYTHTPVHLPLGGSGLMGECLCAEW